MTITVNTADPVSNGILFAGVATDTGMVDASGLHTITGVGTAVTTNARGAALVMGAGKYVQPVPNVTWPGRSSGQNPTGMTYLFIGDVVSSTNDGFIFEDISYNFGFNEAGLIKSDDGGVSGEVKIADNINGLGTNKFILFTIGDGNDQDLRLYVDGQLVVNKTSGLSGWYAHNITSIAGSIAYPNSRVVTGNCNRAIVWGRKLTTAECANLIANPDRVLSGLPAPDTAPDAPTNVVATVGGTAGTASIAFTAPTNDGGDAITSYTVTASTGQTATGTAPPIVVSGLAAVATTFTVTATNSVGTGPASAASSSITPTAAPVDNTAPTFVSATTSVDGTGITITFSETLGNFTPATSAFALVGKTIGGISRNAAAITLTGISPAYAYGDVITVSYTKPGTNQLRDIAGNEVASFGPVSVNNALPAPPPPGTIIKTFGSAAGSDYPNLNAAIDYANTVDCAATGQKVILKATSPVLSVNKTVGTNGNNDCYIEIRPDDALSFAALNPTGALNETVAGLKMTLASGSQLRVGRSVRITGFIMDMTVTEAIQTASVGTGPKASLRSNIILANAPAAMVTGGYVSMQFLDNLIIRTAAVGGKMIQGYWDVEARRNTFVLKAGATAEMAHDGGWTGSAAAENNVYYGFSGDPIPNNFPNCTNCVTNTALSYTHPGITVDTTNPFFVGANDYRASTALIGKANYYAQSTPDLRGDNRGPVADVGAIEGTPSLPFPRGTVIEQLGPDGSSLTINFSYTNTADSGTIMLIPYDKTSGAQAQGPFPVTLNTGNKTGTVTLDDIIPGRYQAPSILLFNVDGSMAVVGTLGFEILGMDSAAEDTSVSEPATAVIWSVPASGIEGQASANITVGLNGTSNSTIRVTPNDNSAGGVFTPAYLDIVNGSGGTFTYTRPTVGTSTLSLTNNGNLTNPASVQYTANAVPPGPAAPTITLTTATNQIMSGKTATVSGAVNLQGDASGTVTVFADPQPSGAAINLGAANVSNGVWTKQGILTKGQWKLRAIATANNQTLSVTSGTVKVLGLVGNFTLPGA